MQPGALEAQHERLRPFEEAELALVRSVVNLPHWLAEPDEQVIRYALNLARLTRMRSSGGEEVDLSPLLEPYRDQLLAVIEPLLLRPGGVDRIGVGRIGPHLA